MTKNEFYSRLESFNINVVQKEQLWTILNKIQSDISDIDLSNYVTNENLTNVLCDYVKGTDLKTINGESIVGSGDITLDLSLYKVVSSLPSTEIDENKIYLVLNANGENSNIYIEYVYVDGEWEELGEYRAEIDLTDYVTETDYASSDVGGVIKTGYTTSDKNYAVQVDSSGNAFVNVPWVDTDTTYENASATSAGLMSIADKTKLDNIDVDKIVISDDLKTINGETILGDGNIEITDTTYEVATQSSNGLLSAADKTKLDNITEDADSVSFTGSLTGGVVIGTLTINGTSYTLYSTDNTTYNTATTSSDGLMSSTDKVKVDLLETDGNGSRYLTNAGTYVNPFPVVTEEEALTILADGTISHRGISQMKDWDITTTDYDLDYLNSTYPDAPVGFQLVQYTNGKIYEKVSSTGQWITYSCTLLE